MSAIDLNSIGLALDIVGALLIWFFVAEVNYSNKKEFLKGNALIEIKDPTQEEINKYKKNILLSRVGISLLIFGFILQLISNYN